MSVFTRAKRQLRHPAIWVIAMLLLLPGATCRGEGFEIGGAWDNERMERLYRNAFYDIKEYDRLSKLMTFMIFECPIVADLSGLMSDLFWMLERSKLKAIVAECKNRYPMDYWRQVFHLADKLSRQVEMQPDYDCKTFATSFVSAFKRLKLPIAFVGQKQFIGMDSDTDKVGMHVLNVFAVAGSDGNIYAYIIDLGFAPGRIYPLTQTTIEYHQAHPTQLPPIYNGKQRAGKQ